MSAAGTEQQMVASLAAMTVDVMVDMSVAKLEEIMAGLLAVSMVVMMVDALACEQVGELVRVKVV